MPEIDRKTVRKAVEKALTGRSISRQPIGETAATGSPGFRTILEARRDESGAVAIVAKRYAVIPNGLSPEEMTRIMHEAWDAEMGVAFEDSDGGFGRAALMPSPYGASPEALARTGSPDQTDPTGREIETELKNVRGEDTPEAVEARAEVARAARVLSRDGEDIVDEIMAQLSQESAA